MNKHLVRSALLACVVCSGFSGFAPPAALAQAGAKDATAGDALLASKSYPQAEAAFRKALAADPNDTHALQGLVTALDKQGKFAEEATVAEHMADVFMQQANQTAAPKPAAPAAAVPANPANDKDAQIAELQRQLAALQAAKNAAPATTPPAPPAIAAAQTPAPAPAAPQAFAPSAIKFPAPDKSDIVAKGPKGDLGVAKKDGTPIEGFKLSQHDMSIGSPSMAVGADGTIHLVFVEQHSTTYAYAVYYRSSTDGGKTWSDAKNLSEDMTNIAVGHCQILVDSANRVYAIWRAGFEANWPAPIYPAGNGTRTNLYYRVLAGGKWSAAKPIHTPGTSATQGYAGSLSYFAAVDAAGHAQVLWTTTPDQSHPEVVNPIMQNPHWLYNGIGNGQIHQAMLDGTTVSAPREVFMPEVKTVTNAMDNTSHEKFSDGLDTINGYIDSAGTAHLVAEVTTTHDPVAGKTRCEVIENGKAGQIIDLPELSFHAWSDMPTMLIDAKGRRHVIALYLAGEHPNFRDYLIGSDEEPTVIFAAKGLKGICNGFQAFQGPGGQMAIIMQATGDTGDQGDTWVSTSDGTAWSPPICVTNNAARQLWATTNTSTLSSVSHGTRFHPGVGAAAFDRDGHLLLALVNGKVGTFGSSVGGALIASGSTESPMLFFFKF